jgi:hypothetical protein
VLRFGADIELGSPRVGLEAVTPIQAVSPAQAMTTVQAVAAIKAVAAIEAVTASGLHESFPS